MRAISDVGLLALVLIVVAVVSKGVGSGLGAKLGGFNYGDSVKVGIGMIPRMEVALIIARTGLNKGVIGESVFSITIILVIVTTLITPFLLKLAFRE